MGVINAISSMIGTVWAIGTVVLLIDSFFAGVASLLIGCAWMSLWAAAS